MDFRDGKRNLGFTLAEMLIVTAITVILAGVGFTAVIAQQRSLRLTEADNIAREIYEGAQNHLTAAESGGTWDAVYASNQGSADFLGTQITDENNPVKSVSDTAPHDFRSLTVNEANASSMLSSTALKYILPSGSIDETIRSGGTYVIEYDAATAQIYGVFYTKDQNFDTSDVSSIDKMSGGRKNEDNRIQYEDGGTKYAIGWYGGATASKTAKNTASELSKPTVTLLNEARLILKVEYSLPASMKNVKESIVIENSASPSQKADYLTSVSAGSSTDSNKKAVRIAVDRTNPDVTKYTEYYILDSVVDGKEYHFGNLSKDFDVLLGKNIIAVVTLTDSSGKKTTGQSDVTNSLYADGTIISDSTVSARVSNGRHLENLSEEISGINNNNVNVTQAVITGSIAWSGDNSFLSSIDQENSSDNNGYNLLGGKKFSQDNSHTVFSFNGTQGEKDHYVGIVSSQLSQVKASANAVLSSFTTKDGLFREIKNSVTISNLTLQDFTVSSASAQTAGALLSTTSSDDTYTINNVQVKSQADQIAASDASAGGLIGTVVSKSTVNVSASYVSVGGVVDTGSSGSHGVGGFIGEIQSDAAVTVNSSYTAGRTSNGSYEGDYAKNVSGSGSDDVGGFIGRNKGTLTIQNSYTTASVTAESGSAGGFIGSSKGTDTFSMVYSTGLVTAGSSAKTGAFAGSLANTDKMQDCFAIYGINGKMNLVGSQNSVTGIAYQNNGKGVFAGSSGSASPYDSSLANTYPFRTTAQLAGSQGGSHTGDWPTKFEASSQAAVVYYEVVDDTYYYNGYTFGSDINGMRSIQSSNSLIEGTSKNSKGKYVTASGYAVLLKTGTTVSSVKYEGDNSIQSFDQIASTDAGNLASSLGFDGYTAYIIDPDYYTYNDIGEKTSGIKESKTKLSFYLNENTKNSYSVFMNPNFANCIAAEKADNLPSITKYQIRSAAQLYRLLTSRNTSAYLNTSGFEINQTMDINMSGYQSAPYSQAVKAVYQGIAPEGYQRQLISLSAAFATDIASDGKLQNLDFVSPSGTSLISDSNSGTIENITIENGNFTGSSLCSTNSGTVNNVKAVNVTAGGSGLIGTMTGGTVSSCQIYGNASKSASNSSSDPYGLVQIGSTAASPDLTNSGSNTAGFIGSATGGTIKNCSVTGEVYGTSGAAGFIFSAQNVTITNCYANTIVNAYKKEEGYVPAAAGFAVYLYDDTTVSYSHSLGVLNSKDGWAAGFAAANLTDSIDHCYSAVWNALIDSNQTYVLFANDGSFSNSSDYVMNTVFVNSLQRYAAANDSKGVTLTNRAGLISVANDLGGTAGSTVKYGVYNTDAADMEYPFGMPSNTTAYGDWPPSTGSLTVQTTTTHQNSAKYGLYEAGNSTTSTGGPFAIEAVVYCQGNTYRYQYYLTRNGQRICSFNNIMTSDNSSNMSVDMSLTSDIAHTYWTSDVKYSSIENYLNTRSTMTGTSKDVYELHYTRDSASGNDLIAGADTTCVITMRDGTVYVTNTVQQINITDRSISWGYSDEYDNRYNHPWWNKIQPVSGVTLKRYMAEVSAGTDAGDNLGAKAVLTSVDTGSDDLNKLTFKYTWYELKDDGSLGSPVREVTANGSSGDFIPFTSLTTDKEYVCVVTNVVNDSTKYTHSWYAESSSFKVINANY